VLFEPFIGVGPRPFPHLFAMRLGNGYPVKRKGDGGKIVTWDPAQANLRVPNIPFSYVEREDLALAPYKNLQRSE
jgi:hypothetical protein